MSITNINNINIKEINYFHLKLNNKKLIYFMK